MNKITLQLNQLYKSFNSQFKYEFEGSLILLSGINGAGKSQITNILLGQEGKDNNFKINSTILINNVPVTYIDIEYRSFKDNISLPEITPSNSQSFIRAGTQAWDIYKSTALNPTHQNNRNHSASCVIAKSILLEYFSEQDFNEIKIPEDVFKQKLNASHFIWKQTDIFTNSIGEIFFNHALKISEKMKDVGRANFDNSQLPTAPWEELNSLFNELNLDYRFKDDYWIQGVEINEQPKLHEIDQYGSIKPEFYRSLKDLSDGEKTIISLCFASLSGTTASHKKLLLLDEIDAVLNPSLILTFFTVIKRYFLDKGVTVLMTTHSPATISLSPLETRFYEVFRSNQSGHRILEVSRDEYTELQIANKDFYTKIQNQEQRIKSLESKIESHEEILIITEGKTDWKYMLSVLREFHSKGEFIEIKEEYFYRFGSQKDVDDSVCDTQYFADLSESQLNTFLGTEINARAVDTLRRQQIRIGIFDSDTNIQTKQKAEYGIHSFKIKPDGISIEFLFIDSDLKSEVFDQRIYIGSEFDPRTSQHTSEILNLGSGSQKKAGKKEIIDCDVYDSNGDNKALSKEKFATALYNSEIQISDESLNNFKHIFTEIVTLLP